MRKTALISGGLLRAAMAAGLYLALAQHQDRSARRLLDEAANNTPIPAEAPGSGAVIITSPGSIGANTISSSDFLLPLQTQRPPAF